MPISIAGMHRSGASMMSRLLNLFGVYRSREDELITSNRERFWENANFVKINDEIPPQVLSAQGVEEEEALQIPSSQLAEQTNEEPPKQIERQTGASISASPNPIRLTDGSNLGQTAIAYTFPEAKTVEVRVGSPDGPLFARPNVSGTATTGKWVRDGTAFFLQDVSEGKALTKKHTLATVTVRVTTEESLTFQVGENEARPRLLTQYGQIKYRYVFPLLQLLRLMPSSVAQNDGLRVGLDTKIPDSLVIGKGNALYIGGWCYHSSQRIKRLDIVANGKPHRVNTFRMGRRDILATHFPGLDPNGFSYRSGFWTILPLTEIDRPIKTNLFIRATLANGEACSERIARITLKPANERLEELDSVGPPRTNDQPLIAICMATHNPPFDLFARQVQSIREQTYTNWICIISDDDSSRDILERMQAIIGVDKRFSVYDFRSRLGFYRNFERCISLVPEEAEFVALCDQDDYWHSDKLDVLLSQFDNTTTLTYSDMNIVDGQGYCMSNTFWTTRPNNSRNLASMILSNTVTGAASLFSRRLLNHVLPFPERIGDGYHDHWIACVALALGTVKYVARPLHDYVQHSGNLVGHYAPPESTFWKEVKGFLRFLGHPKEILGRDFARWQTNYFNYTLRAKLLSRVLALRCGTGMTSLKKREVLRLTRIDESFPAYLWLAIRALKNLWRVSSTLGGENRIHGAIWWKRFWALKSWLKTGTFTDVAIDRSLRPEVSQEWTTSPAQSEAPVTTQVALSSFKSVELIRSKIARLSLEISHTAPKRVNLLIPTIDLRYVFGGYITKFNLARKLAQSGFTVRIVIVDFCDYQPSLWQHQLQAFQGLERLLECVEMTYALDRAKALEVNEDDIFIATTWWTAHIAHQATRDLKKERFLYLIQEYEPFTFPMGTFAAVAKQSYDFPHFGIFSTSLLRDYFKENRLGVFIRGEEAGDRHSTCFQNAITPVGEITRENITGRSAKKLLLYARPEDHAARNMFELAVLALSEAIESGVFTGEWEFNGIGTVGTSARVNLYDGEYLKLFPRQSQENYRQVLRSHDIGLSLMYTPHPSLVPIEMASAGMLVVTNTYSNKTAHELAAISSNIIAVEPTIEGVKLGLKFAVQKIGDFDGRIRGSNVRWSTSWERSFDAKVMARIAKFIKASG